MRLVRSGKGAHPRPAHALCHNARMSVLHIIVPSADLQGFESKSATHEPFSEPLSWSEVSHERIECAEQSLAMPWELAYARALNLPRESAGIAWAAYETRRIRQPCAWIYPCHLDVGMTDMVLQPVHQLRLSDSESRELLALLAPYFEEDGISLRFDSAGRWLAQGAVFADLPCASLARVQGQSINAFLPDPGEFPKQTRLARLQAEIQMLLYAHALNDARAARGLPSVNSFWIDGAGQLEALPQADPTTVRLETRLQDALSDVDAYAGAWRDLKAQWDQAAAGSSALRITLCGHRQARCYAPQAPSLRQRFSRLFGTQPSPNIRSLL
jgi:hypothetical protein